MRVGAEIAKATGRRVVPLIADVTKSMEIERAVARIHAELGGLHLLVNNLGDAIQKPLVPLPDGAADAAPLADDELRTILDLNLTATVLCSRAAGPAMLARRTGKVINIGSFASARGGRELTVYAAAKTALVGFNPRARARVGALRGPSERHRARLLSRRRTASAWSRTPRPAGDPGAPRAGRSRPASWTAVRARAIPEAWQPGSW